MKSAGIRLFLVLAVTSLTLTALPGCISRSAYDENINRLAIALQEEKAARAAAERQLDHKIQERGKTLGEMTNKYIELQRNYEQVQVKVVRFRGDLEKLLHDVDELKLVVHTNVKGSPGSEMMIKLLDMERRLNLLLDRNKAESETGNR